MSERFKQLLRTRRFWVAAILAIVALVALFDRDSLVERAHTKQRIGELSSQRDYLQQQIRADSLLLENLRNDRFLERYAREHFLMRRPGETLYLIDTSELKVEN